jgi:hypothetical protein
MKAKTLNSNGNVVHLKEGKGFINDAEVVLADVTTNKELYMPLIR